MNEEIPKLKPEKENSGYHLTSQGYNFIGPIRGKGIWEETTIVVAETGGNATLEMVKAIATGFLRKKLSVRADIEL